MSTPQTSVVTLGRTGLATSRIAFGALDALNQAAFERAVELGINFFISFPGYEREQRAIGRAVRHVSRDSVVLAGGSAGTSATAVRRDIKRSLANLRTDCLDIFYLFHVTCESWTALRKPGGAMEQLAKARRAGVVRFTGATVHNRGLALRIIRSGLVDVLNLRYSLAHPGHEAKVFPAAMKHGCGVVAYSALKYGMLLRRPEGWPARRRVPTAEECYRFVLGHAAVHVAWVGARNLEEVEAAADVMRSFKPLPLSTERAFRRFGHVVHDGWNATASGPQFSR